MVCQLTCSYMLVSTMLSAPVTQWIECSFPITCIAVMSSRSLEVKQGKVATCRDVGWFVVGSGLHVPALAHCKSVSF